VATNYPGSIDSLTNPSAGDALTSPSHSAQHANANDAIEAIETELGVNPSGSDATVAARLTAIEAGTNLATGAVTSAKIADGTIATGDIADAAVTVAKLGSDVRIGNLLTANQASVETDTTGWQADGATSIARSTAQAYSGSASMLITSPVSGYGARTVGNTAIPVTAGETYTVTGMVKSASRTQRTGVLWYTAAGAYISESTTPAEACTDWTRLSLTMVAPATAAFVVVFARPGADGTDGDTAYWDCIGLWKGAGGVWSPPGTPVTGQSHIATNGAVHLSGTGSPEGVVTAAPGSTWLQTDAATDVKGWIRWVKATGTGNTGWIAGAEADTGRRDVAASIDADWQANTGGVGYVRLQRVGERVYFEARLDRITASGSRGNGDTVYTAPAGFTPRNAYNIRGLAYGPAGVAGFVGDLSNPAEMQVWFPSGGTWAASDDVLFTAEWYTSDAWPTSLPGSAA
jgi:hypothetical protein